MQTTAETMQLMADIHQTHITEGCLPWQETLKEHATPSSTYAPLVDMHTGTHKKLVEVFEKEQTMEVRTTSIVVQKRDNGLAMRFPSFPAFPSLFFHAT